MHLRRIRICWVPALILLVGAALLIIRWVVARPLWLDEEMIAINIRDLTLRELAGKLVLGQSAPLGWLALERWLLLVFGSGERVLRFVPVLFGLGTLAAVYWIGKRWLDPVAATTLAILCSFSEWVPFYPLELKPYSADAFWAFFLPALAAWAFGVGAQEEQAESPRARAAPLIWWCVAAIGQWFGNGALMVTPPCALLLFAAIWRRRGWRPAFQFASQGAVWLVAFGLHYQLAMTYTVHSDFLRGYWASGFPPASARLGETLRWLVDQMVPFAFKPGGTTLGVMFWLAAILGLIALPPGARLLAMVFGMMPLFAFVYAGLRAVPFVERLALWVVPPLYIGVASLAGWSARLVRMQPVRLTGKSLLVAFVSSVVVFAVVFDIASRGFPDFAPPPRSENHLLDDRSAVRWLMAQRGPTDVLMTTRLGLPALWWYGGPNISGLFGPERAPISREPQIPALEVRYEFPGPECQTNALRDALQGHDGVLLYLGFRFDDVPRGFDDLLVQHLSELGAIVGYRRFGELTKVMVVDLRASPSGPPPMFGKPESPPAIPSSRLAGCLAVRPAAAW